MPLHVAPVIRFLEECLESEGLIQTRDSVGVTLQKAAESGGATKPLPPGAAGKRYIRGTAYTAS